MASKNKAERPALYCLSLAISLPVLPYAFRFPLWITILFFCLLTLRMLWPIYFPGGWQPLFIGMVKLLFVILTLSGVYATYGSLVGRQAGIALLIILAPLKMIEYKKTWDFYVVACLGLFLVITNFLYSQTLLITLYLGLAILITITSLIMYNGQSSGLTPTQSLRLSGKLLGQSIPIMLLLFTLFPRIHGPLWGLPQDEHSGRTGLSNEITPGSINTLVYSDEIVFRVEFYDAIPEMRGLYWRGPVLWHTDGKTWTTGPAPKNDPPNIAYQGEKIVYEVTMEPSKQDWLFAIELPADLPEQAYLTHDHQLKSSTPLSSRRRYTVSSYPNFQIRSLPTVERQQALALPMGKHPRARALAAQWKASYHTPEQIIAHALSYLQQGGYRYTLQPPLMENDVVDELLFEKRQGFCAHYATSFAVLMRAAGIPARVITGYQGGEVNPVGNYLIVRQYHAHAWIEVWLAEAGWTRIDPTTVVSPARITEGILDDTMLEQLSGIPINIIDNHLLRSVWKKIKQNWDRINYRWSRWILGYGVERQRSLLARLGLAQYDWIALSIGMATGILLLLLGHIAWMLRTRNQKCDPSRRLYERYCRTLSRIGLNKRIDEGPNTFAQRAIRARSDLKADIQAITKLYMDIHYGALHQELGTLRKKIMHFKPGRIATRKKR